MAPGRSPKHPTRLRPVTTTSEVSHADSPTPDWPIVAMGASAGGLEAFEQFFRAMPASSNMAFALTPHLDPDHASVLSEILQRCTTMTVLQVVDQMRVEANHVYVLPPNREMTISRGALHLSVPDKPRGQRLPIDQFMRTLAEERGDQAIGILLSGNGTDGTRGLGDILEAGGVTLVQDPATAQYQGMPTSAIQAGYATRVLSPGEMPDALEHLNVLRSAQRSTLAAERVAAFARILTTLHAATGHDFSHYKRNTISRRIERRMIQLDIRDIGAYAQTLAEHPGEAQQLFKELLINVTHFFRDAEAFDFLKDEVLRPLLKDTPPGHVFRAWVAGCSSGEEAYSIAILLSELLQEFNQSFQLKLYATDLDEDAIATARTALYPAGIAADVSPQRLATCFVQEEHGFRIRKEIRETVVFAVQNITQDPPFTRLDLLVCRNLMIYLEGNLQERVIPLFHYALKPGGVLFLSPSESLGHMGERFSVLHRKWKIYGAIHDAAPARESLPYPLYWSSRQSGATQEGVVTHAKDHQFAELFGRVLLQHYAPASVVIDQAGVIVYVHGETGKYLRPAPGPASLDIIPMAREGLRATLEQALRNGPSQPLVSSDVLVDVDGEFRRVAMTVRPFPDPVSERRLLLISFQDITPEPVAKRGKRGPAKAAQQRISELEQELANTHENQRANTERQQAANEELQSINEELQSTNEELETSKEELQSVNEELTTVNAELHAKIEQLAQMQNDMKNLLESINIGTIFLDQRMKIRRFTREATRIFRLVPTDVGRLLADIKSDIATDELLSHAQTVLKTLVTQEHLVQVTQGIWYLARIQPYRTMENLIDGVVMTFTDITQRMTAELVMRQARELAEGIVDTVREPLVVLDEELKIVSASRSFYDRFHLTPRNVVGKLIYELGGGLWTNPKMRELLDEILPRNQALEGYALEHSDTPGGAKMLLNARRILSTKDSKPLMLLAIEEVRKTNA